MEYNKLIYFLKRFCPLNSFEDKTFLSFFLLSNDLNLTEAEAEAILKIAEAEQQKQNIKVYDTQFTKNGLYNIPFSDYNTKKYFYEDNNHYNFILKSNDIFKLDLFNVLKHLYQQHKITRFDYKDNIKKIKLNKKLTNKVFLHIYFLLKNGIKSISKKTTFRKIKNNERELKNPSITIKFNNQFYKINLKKVAYLMINSRNGQQLDNSINKEVCLKSHYAVNHY